MRGQTRLRTARRAGARSRGADEHATAAALFHAGGYSSSERGAVGAAEEAYRGANQLGLEPQPGLALLRLAQGDSDAAANAIRRVASATVNRLKRMNLLPSLCRHHVGCR